MNAGDLTERISIEEEIQEGQQADGSPIKRWITRFYRWANVQELAGSELVAANQLHGVTTHKVLMRYFTGLEVTHRVRWRRTKMGIVEITERPLAGELEVMVKRTDEPLAQDVLR